jgi:CHAT domain-containing protein
VVSTLWKVNDQASQRLMARFYDNLWGKGMDKLAALHEAQLWMLHGGDEPLANAGRGVGKPGPAVVGPARNSPAVWAGFVLSGDWR